MSSLVSDNTTVRELVGQYRQTRKVFEQRGIDYCCGGGTTLAEAAKAKHLDVADLIAALQAAMEGPAITTTADDTDWYTAPLHDLVQHILSVHHAYLKEALPRIGNTLEKVLRAHAAQHGPMLRQLQTTFAGLDEELSQHLMKEEAILFPYIVAAEASRLGGSARPSACFPSVGNPIRQMETEHESTGQALKRMRQVTNGYALPGDVFATFRALYEEMRHLEQDLRQHIHLENNILFPRAIRAESDPPAGVTKLGSAV